MPQRFSEEKRLEWKERLRLQQESGQTISRWCREHQINYDSFLYWRKRFGLIPNQKIERSSFKELPDRPDSGSGITVEFQQFHIHLSKDFDPSVLTRCLKALKGEAC